MNASISAMKEATGFIKGLKDDQAKRVLRLMSRHDVCRGETLIKQGEICDYLHLVLHGRFVNIFRDEGCKPNTAGHINAGDYVAVAAFLSGQPAQMDAIALRDSEVLRLGRDALDKLSQECPSTFAAFLQLLMGAVSGPIASIETPQASLSRKITTFVQGSGEAVPQSFWSSLRIALTKAHVKVIDAEEIYRRFGVLPTEGPRLAELLNNLANDYGPLVCLADRELTEWTQRAIRQADEVVIVTRGPAPSGNLTAIERCIADLHDAAHRRLVRVHDKRVSVTSGTANWLSRMECFLHHHVALQDQLDFQSLARFLTDQAIGFIAGGGGALGAAHVGVFRAFAEENVSFDIFGGTSVGAAMLAGFCRLQDAERLDLGTHRIFVESRSFKRFSLPRYGLLDHRNFDRALQREYGAETLIEDCWRPFFAVASNLSTKEPEIIKRGVMWKAVRASSAIPGILPPLYTSDGMMLVDGGIMQNVPVAAMHSLKSGPNVVVHFNTAARRRFIVDYAALPGPGRLLARALNPFERLPRAPSPTAVLWRSLLAHQGSDIRLNKDDVEICPPKSKGASVMNFSRHREVYLASHAWAKNEIALRIANGNTALLSVLGTCNPSISAETPEAAGRVRWVGSARIRPRRRQNRTL